MGISVGIALSELGFYWYAPLVSLILRDGLLTNTHCKACGLYYYVWMVLLPRLGGYEIIEEVENLKGGARTATLVRRYHNQNNPNRTDHPEEGQEHQHLLSSSS